MAYDANLDATFNPSVGGTPTAAWADILNANFAYLGAAWTSYTPTWTCATTPPALGNGTISGAYRQTGKTLDFRIHFVAGSTSTMGTGAFRFSLPNSLTGITGVTQTVSGYLLDGTTTYVLTGLITGATAYVTMASNGSTANVNVGTITWGSGDAIHLTGTIEVS